MSIRHAQRSDIPVIVDILAKAFWDEDAVGRFMHPYREQYPHDMKKYWRRTLRETWWKENHSQLVIVNEQRIVVGYAGWALVDGELSVNKHYPYLVALLALGDTRCYWSCTQVDN